MEVASLENCQRLYELSKWARTHYVWHDDSLTPLVCGYEDVKHALNFTPAYDVGYLLRKLPLCHPVSRMFAKTEIVRTGKDSWHTYWLTEDDEWELYGDADTPEDAACLLAIELFKQGVLK